VTPRHPPHRKRAQPYLTTTDMRPLRLLLSLSTSLLAVAVVLYITLASHQDEQSQQNSPSAKQGGFKALLSFTTPGSLFPPSAIISLTDDNSTFFLARPAAFGPALPNDGLSSALWIGSGFGDDTMAKGELGCDDSPDWHDQYDARKHTVGVGPNSVNESKDKVLKARAARPSSTLAYTYVRPTPGSHSSASTQHKTANEHADIQSLQESAEIDGKVVLLKRGGCGFSTKVLWAQRRGAVAVIVGDNVRGGGLIRMYAQGDTSNITIPSLFTSHTTAHLLSSLLPQGALQSLRPGHATYTGSDIYTDDVALEGKDDKALFTSSRIPIAAPTSSSGSLQHHSSSEKSTKGSHGDQGWLGAVFGALGIGHGDPVGTDSRSSGALQAGASMDDQTAKSSVPTSNNLLPGGSAYSPKTKSERKVRSVKRVGSREDGATRQLGKHSGRSITSITNTNMDTIANTLNSTAHEGLWVTLTPTNASTSPFFDTLLVLVVSPLVTLTVVYALLLLRSRIRRRRWRAPKSLVDRLPIRTYHTLSDSTSTTTPSASSPTTPLLHHSSTRSTSSTHSQTPSSSEVPATSSAAQVSHPTREEEKRRENGLAEWRRRYGGRQKECVVCLEEYVDGISKVMSLPCGHEFHADCM
jgi:hypothetical protein